MKASTVGFRIIMQWIEKVSFNIRRKSNCLCWTCIGSRLLFNSFQVLRKSSAYAWEGALSSVEEALLFEWDRDSTLCAGVSDGTWIQAARTHGRFCYGVFLCRVAEFRAEKLKEYAGARWSLKNTVRGARMRGGCPLRYAYGMLGKLHGILDSEYGKCLWLDCVWLCFAHIYFWQIARLT